MKFKFFFVSPSRKYFEQTDYLCLFFMILVLVSLILPFFYNITYISKNPDWVNIFAFAASARDSVINFHQFPLWSNLFCGGYPLIANPYDVSLTPFFMFVLIAGEVIGVKFSVLLLLFIGCAGMYYLTRNVLAYNRIGAVFSSLVFVLCPWWAAEARSGSFPKFSFCLLPAALSFFIKSKESVRYLTLCSLILALLILQSGFIYFIVIIFLFLYSISDIFNSRGAIKGMTLYLKMLLAACALSLLLGAVRVIPVAELIIKTLSMPHLGIHKGYVDFCKVVEVVNLKQLFHNWLFSPVKNSYVYYDYGHSLMYIGFIPLLLFILSTIVYCRKNIQFLFLLFIVILISLGNSSFIDLYKVLWKVVLPFREVHKLDKYFVPVILFLVSIISGRFFLVSERKKRFDKLKQAALITLFIITIIQLFRTQWLYAGIFDIPYPHLKKEDKFFQVRLIGKDAEKTPDKRINYYSLEQYYNVIRRIGTINAAMLFTFGENPIPRYYYHIGKDPWRERPSDPELIYKYKEDNPFYKGEVFLAEEKSGEIKLISLSPRLIVIKTVLSKQSDIIINQNYYSGWHSNFGRLKSSEGLLSVEGVKEGAHTIILNYSPFWYYVGLSVTLSSLLFAFFLLNKKQK